MKMKKLLAAALAAAMTLSLAACGNNGSTSGGDKSTTTPPAGNQSTSQGSNATPTPSGASEITLWTYPVGNWGKEDQLQPLLDTFKADTGINVKVEYLAYTDGDDKVNTALTAGGAPDLIMEGPQRLVSNWGGSGKMVDLSDMLDDTDKNEIIASALNASTSPDGKLYMYPLVMTAHCMAVNLNAFKDAGADQYLDLENHTWTTENFIKAVEALYAKSGQTVAAVYCAGQGGDQGTRALINNLYGGSFVNAAHDGYTWDDANNIKALEQLKSMEGIAFDASLAGGDEIAKFYQGVLQMAFCWNIQQQSDPNGAGTGAGKTLSGDDIAFMAFPSEDGKASLCGGWWGFGIFDNGDQARIDAAKTFIKYMCDSEHTADAVRTATFYPARVSAENADLSNVWEGNDLMAEYSKLIPMLGEYYEDTKGWTQARTSWWNMLQDIGEGADIASTVATFQAEANAAG